MYSNKISALKKQGYASGYEGIATFRKNGKKTKFSSIFMTMNKADYNSAAEYYGFVGKVRRISLKTQLRRWRRQAKKKAS